LNLNNMDNYNYPLGADTSEAPWNQPDPPYRDFNVTVSQSLSKTLKINTNNYIDGEVSEEADFDGEGNGYMYFTQAPPNTSNTDWKTLYSDKHYTPLELIAELKNTKEAEVSRIEAEMLLSADEYTTKLLKMQLQRANHFISECDNWIEDEYEIVED